VKYEIQIAGKTRAVELTRAPNSWQVTLDGVAQNIDAAEISPGVFSILLNGQSHEVRIAAASDGTLTLQDGPHEWKAQVTDPRVWRGRRHGATEVEGRQQIVAPMPGKVIRVLVKVGDQVEVGQGLLVVEAMKMQNEVRSPKTGKVEKLSAKEGQAVNSGDTLAWID
jgi:biotin carboxyl carrier protein